MPDELQTQMARLEERLASMSRQLDDHEKHRMAALRELRDVFEADIRRIEKRTDQIIYAITFVVIALAAIPAGQVIASVMP